MYHINFNFFLIIRLLMLLLFTVYICPLLPPSHFYMKAPYIKRFDFITGMGLKSCFLSLFCKILKYLHKYFKTCMCDVMKKQKLIYDAIIITYWRNNYYLAKMTFVPPVRTISAGNANI